MRGFLITDCVLRFPSRVVLFPRPNATTRRDLILKTKLHVAATPSPQLRFSGLNTVAGLIAVIPLGCFLWPSWLGVLALSTLVRAAAK